MSRRATIRQVVLVVNSMKHSIGLFMETSERQACETKPVLHFFSKLGDQVSHPKLQACSYCMPHLCSGGIPTTHSWHATP